MLKYSTPLQMESRIVVETTLLILCALLVGCASLVEKGKLPKVVARHTPDIQLGAELILLEKPPILTASLIDKEGTAHIFVVDKKRRLNHIKIIDRKIIAQEFLGIIDTKQTNSFDIVEYPPGKLRVLAGDKQYFQVAPNLEWREIKGNRCAQFVPLDDELFCAFIINGEEIEAPERTDYTFGWFLLVPIIFWSHEHASKLVLAQKSHDDWVIRAVVDPDTLMDADRDFMIGSDQLGDIHFLYSTSKGGGAFFVFAYGYGGGASANKPKTNLRYAQLKFDQILSHSSDSQHQALGNHSPPMKWMAIKGAPLEKKPLIKKDFNYPTAPIGLKPLNRNFLVNKETGDVTGLMWASQCTLVDDVRELPLFGLDQSVVEVGLRNGKWSQHFNIVTVNDFPASGIIWRYLDNFSIKLDGKGNYHLLLQSLDPGWKNRKYVNYFFKGAVDWSAPLILGRSHITSNVISLAVDDSGVAFAAWVNEKGIFIGRWIKPRTGNPQ